MNGEHIRLKGIVQGVGFRVTVEHLARRHALRGWVRNDGSDVLVAVVGAASDHEAFLDALLHGLPPHARVDHVERTPTDVESGTGFMVIASVRG